MDVGGAMKWMGRGYEIDRGAYEIDGVAMKLMGGGYEIDGGGAMKLIGGGGYEIDWGAYGINWGV